MNSLFDIINIPFSYVIRFFYGLTDNYLLTLLLFAIVMKIVLFPLGIKQQKNMVKQASLRPKEQVIRKKYAGRNDKVTQQKVNEEVMALYQKEGYSPASGCLPMIFQLVIVWAVYQIVYNPLTYIMQLTDANIVTIKTYLGNLNLKALEGVDIDKLREINLIGHLKDQGVTTVAGKPLPNFNLWGSFGDLSTTPSIGNIDWIWLIPLFVLVSTYLSMKLTRKFSYQPQMNGTGDAGLSMKIMDYTMPLFSTVVSFSMPAAIGVYWVFQSVLGVAQQFLLSKIIPIPKFSEEDLKAYEKEYGATSNRQKKKQERANVRSLHHIDDEDYDDRGNLIEQPKEAPAIDASDKTDSYADASDGSDSYTDGKKGKKSKKSKKSVSGIDHAPMQDDEQN